MKRAMDLAPKYRSELRRERVFVIPGHGLFAHRFTSAEGDLLSSPRVFERINASETPSPLGPFLPGRVPAEFPGANEAEAIPHP